MGVDLEQSFGRLGYLLAPLPPRETQRVAALDRYGDPGRAGEWANMLNFHRMAHVVKLSLNVQTVIISLVAEDSLKVRTAAGRLHDPRAPAPMPFDSRERSFCAHAILQDSDEPMVVLDAAADWRFARIQL